MWKYSNTSNGYVVREIDGNVEYKSLDSQDIIDWIAQGNTPDPADPPSQEQIKQALVNAIQDYLDAEARMHSYDGILSLCSYATSENPKFGPEGKAGVIWRDACWAKGYETLAACEAGTMAIPTVDELLSQMPKMIWPE